MTTITVTTLDRESAADIAELADLLLDAVDDNAGVSFMRDLTHERAAAWWREILSSMPPRGAVFVARDSDGIAGTVQLHPSWAPNQPHRADVAKLMVHRRARNRGYARALMLALERHAREQGFTLLLLDTRRGDKAEKLYVSMGWERVGVVPDFALNPDGSWCDTVFYYRKL